VTISGNRAAHSPDIALSQAAFVSDGYNLIGANPDHLPLKPTDLVVAGGFGAFDEETGLIPLTPDSPVRQAVMAHRSGQPAPSLLPDPCDVLFVTP
jgi:hypothetical protein